MPSRHRTENTKSEMKCFEGCTRSNSLVLHPATLNGLLISFFVALFSTLDVSGLVATWNVKIKIKRMDMSELDDTFGLIKLTTQRTCCEKFAREAQGSPAIILSCWVSHAHLELVLANLRLGLQQKLGNIKAEIIFASTTWNCQMHSII